MATKFKVGKPGEVEADPEVFFWLEGTGNAIFLRAQVRGGHGQTLLTVSVVGGVGEASTSLLAEPLLVRALGTDKLRVQS